MLTFCIFYLNLHFTVTVSDIISLTLIFSVHVCHNSTGISNFFTTFNASLYGKIFNALLFVAIHNSKQTSVCVAAFDSKPTHNMILSVKTSGVWNLRTASDWCPAMISKIDIITQFCICFRPCYAGIYQFCKPGKLRTV